MSNRFLDEKAVRDELTRTFDVCVDCRRCTDFCGTFDTLFDLTESHRDAGRLAPAQQDDVVDRCFQCDACVSICPYTPDQHELAIDVPKMMIRALAMRSATGQRSRPDRRAARSLGRPDRVGRLGSRFPSIANWFVGASAGGIRRRALSIVTGVTATRRLPMFATERFSQWFRARSARPSGDGAETVVVVPTCLVEYGETQIGKDLVAVFERDGFNCVLSGAGCCGAASLHAGDLDRFAELATNAVTALASEIREHGAIVVPQAACATALRRHAIDHVAPHARADAEFVAAKLTGPSVLIPAPTLAERSVVLVEQAHASGASANDLLTAAGVDVEVTRVGVGITSTWGLRATNDEAAASRARRAAEQIGAGVSAVAGEDALANQMIFDQVKVPAVHPFQLLVGEPVDTTGPDR